MSELTAYEGQITTEKEAIAQGKTDVQLWLDKINAAKAEEKDWRESAKRASDIYEAEKDATPHFNIYHANVEVVIPALYSSTPIPDVRRRNEPPAQPDQIDPQTGQPMPAQPSPEAKIYADIAELIERALYFSVDQYPFDALMEDVVRDAAVTGRGVPRIRYTPQVGQQGVEYQEVTCELVPWDRFIRGPGFAWRQVPFVAFDHDLTKDQVEALLDGNAARLKEIGFSHARDDGTDFGEEKERQPRHKGILKTIKVYEVWDKRTKSVLFITPEDKTRPLVVEKDPLGLAEFFPVPEPLKMQGRTRSLTPVCPYDVYATLINEIEKISERIKHLIKQLVVKGGYDPKMAPDFEMLRDAEDGTYVPISASEEFLQGKGQGLEAAVLHWPIEQIVKVLQALYVEREQVKATIYEVMGISDILRGNVDPREKLGQSELKAQTGSQRLERKQRKVADVARALLRMKAEVMMTHFEPQVLEMMTGIPVSPEMQQVMRSQMRSFVIDIETDSTVRADMAKYQEELSTFLQGTAQFGQTLANIAPVMPQTVAPLTKVYSSFARKFNLGKVGEDALEELTEAGQQPPQQPGDNGAAEAQAMDMQMRQAEMEMKQGEAAMKMDLEMRKLDREDQRAAVELEIKQLEIELKQLDIAAKREEIAMKGEETRLNLAAKGEELAMKREGQEMDMAAKAREAEHRERMGEMELESGAMGMDMKREAHQQGLEMKREQAAQRTNGSAR